MNETNKQDAPEAPATSTKKPRGFATLTPEQHREICRKGGVAAHRAGTAHEFTAEEAQVAGRKGGKAKKSSASK